MEFNRLSDDVLLTIIGNLNLNDRVKLRFVNHRLKCLCDSLPINKLIVFNGLPAVPGKLKYTGEEYTLIDTVDVDDLSKFFRNSTILKQLANVKTLAIESTNPKAFGLRTKFDQLEYLSLTHLLFKDVTILNSPKIKYLILDHCYFKPVDEIEQIVGRTLSRGPQDESYSVFMYQLEHLKSRNIKYLNLMSACEHNLFAFLMSNRLLNTVEELELSLYDFGELLLLNHVDFFPSLKTIRCIVGLKIEQFNRLVNACDLNKLLKKLRDDVAVYLFGIRLNKDTLSFITGFMKQFGSKLRVNRYKLEYIMLEESYKYIKKYENKYDLTGFYDSISLLHLGQQIIVDEKLFKKFRNLEHLCFSLFQSPGLSFRRVLAAFPKLKSLWIVARDVKVNYGNEILNQIPKTNPDLIYLSIDNRNNEIKFDFLFELRRLNFIKMNLGFPIDQSEFIELIRTLKYVRTVDIRFVKPDDLNKEQLKWFKKQVNDCLANELKRPDHYFTIKIYSGGPKESFVRYLMKPKDAQDVMEDFDKIKMFQASDLRHQDKNAINLTVKWLFDVWFLNIDDYLNLNKSFI